MKRTYIIKKNYEFRYFFRKGKYFSGELLEIFVFENKKGINKLGIVVSKKVGGSVVRNRIKRYIREAFTEIEDSIVVDSNVLIVWKKNVIASKANFFSVKKDLTKLLEKAEVMEKK